MRHDAGKSYLVRKGDLHLKSITSEVSQLVKVLVAYFYDLSSILESDMVEEKIDFYELFSEIHTHAWPYMPTSPTNINK